MNVDIIAEIGLNHDGSYEKARQMIMAAKGAGVKIVKFQHYDAEKLLGKASPYYEYAKSCQFTKEQHEHLKSFCDALNMEYLVSVFDCADVLWADALCKRHKIASRMNQDAEFIKTVFKTNKEVIMSIQGKGWMPMDHNQPRLMYCITKYPTPESDMENLPCNSHLGLSSHCPSILPTLRAIAQGANIVEHHVKFMGDNEGCDKSSSITFEDLKELNRFANTLEIV